LGKRACKTTDSPAFQWYAAEYLADENVTLMTLEEEGAYIRAISYCWREGSIPSDPVLLSRLLKNAAPETIQTIVQRFRKIETETGTRLLHGRLEKERKKQMEWRRKSAEGGKLSGKVRRAKKINAEPNVKGGSQMVEPNTNRPLEPNANSSSSSSSSSKEQKQKHSRAKRESDDGMKHSKDLKHMAFKEAIEAYWKFKNGDLPMPWGPMEGAQLGMWLRDAPHITLEQFQGMLRARAKSKVNHGERPAQWIKWITSYGPGPVNEFKNTMQEGGDGSHANGNGSGKSHGSPTKQRVNDNLRAIAEAAHRRGVPGFDVVGSRDSKALPEPGPDGLGGRDHAGLRAVGPEILAPESASGGGGTAYQGGAELFPKAK